MKLIDGNTIIYRNTPMFGYFLFWTLTFFCLFVGSTLWATMIWVESYYDIHTEDIFFSMGLAFLGLIFLIGTYKCTKTLVYIYKEKPIFILNKIGIKYYDDRFFNWTEIEKIILKKDFDVKYLTICSIDKKQISYQLDATQTTEFNNLQNFKTCLNKFPVKVEIEG